MAQSDISHQYTLQTVLQHDGKACVRFFKQIVLNKRSCIFLTSNTVTVIICSAIIETDRISYWPKPSVVKMVTALGNKKYWPVKTEPQHSTSVNGN